MVVLAKILLVTELTTVSDVSGEAMADVDTTAVTGLATPRLVVELVLLDATELELIERLVIAGEDGTDDDKLLERLVLLSTATLVLILVCCEELGEVEVPVVVVE